MPRPMLLIRGLNLSAAQVHLSDPNLKIESTQISENGHWAQLWLNASPARPETITITIKTPHGTTFSPYEFQPKHTKKSRFCGLFLRRRHISHYD